METREEKKNKLNARKLEYERVEYNEKILDRLRDFFKENPDMRFIQGLSALGLPYLGNLNESTADRFYEESKETFERIKNIDNYYGD